MTEPTGWQAPPQGWQQPQAQKKGGCLKFGVVGLAVIGALVLGLLVLIVVAVGSMDTDDEVASGTADHPAVDDVSPLECVTDEQGWMVAKGTITNHSSKPSDYVVEVVFESPDGSQQLDTGLANAQALQPGQEKPFEAGTLTEGPAGFTCRVADVTRLASS